MRLKPLLMRISLLLLKVSDLPAVLKRFPSFDLAWRLFFRVRRDPQSEEWWNGEISDDKADREKNFCMEIFSFVDSVSKTLSVIFVVMFGFESEQETSLKLTSQMCSNCFSKTTSSILQLLRVANDVVSHEVELNQS